MFIAKVPGAKIASGSEILVELTNIYWTACATQHLSED
jgi:hypothetical protein